MDKRTRILGAVFGAAAAYALLAGVVYPRWIRPLLTLEERIAERQKVLDRLLAEDEAVQRARFEYKILVGRVGSFDAARVETNVRDRLNQLIERHRLTDAAVTPSRPASANTKVEPKRASATNGPSVADCLRDSANKPTHCPRCSCRNLR